MDESELDSIYKKTLSDELVYMTKRAIHNYICLYPHAFGLEIFYPEQPFVPASELFEHLSYLYHDIIQHYTNNQVYFDHTWVK